MTMILDTNRYSDFAQGDAAVKTVLENASEIFLPFVVIAELKYGFLRGRRQRENESRLEKFCQQDGVSILYADELTLSTFAELRTQLRSQGTPLPIHDIWIAALAVQHRLHVYTRDSHFSHLPQVRCL